MKVRMKLILLISSILIVATVVVVFVVYSHQRRNDNVLMELVIYGPAAGLFGRGSLIYYFVVKNDGTFISYRGTGRSREDDSRTRNFMRIVHEREQVILNESDFAHISELVDEIVTKEALVLTVLSYVHIRFIHNGSIYENDTAWSETLANLYSTIIELSPLSVHAHFN